MVFYCCYIVYCCYRSLCHRPCNCNLSNLCGLCKSLAIEIVIPLRGISAPLALVFRLWRKIGVQMSSEARLHMETDVSEKKGTTYGKLMHIFDSL